MAPASSADRLRSTKGVAGSLHLQQSGAFALEPSASRPPAHAESQHLSGGTSTSSRRPPNGSTAGSTNMERGASSGVDPSGIAPYAAQSGMMQRSTSSGVPARNGGPHLHRRSSAANMHSTLLVPDKSPKQPASSGMERVSSLTTFMSGATGAGAIKAHGTGDREQEKRSRRAPAGRVGGGRAVLNRRRLYTSLVRLAGIVSLTLIILYLLRLAIGPLAVADSVDDEASGESAWLGKVGGQGLFNTLETVPYPLSTHPRTPRPAEQSTLALADYLTTRLGSHFSFVAGNLPGRSTPGSQLWLTTATNQTVGIATRHLVAFLDRLETTGGPSAFQPLQATLAVNASSPSVPLDNKDQRWARRAVVTLCRDEGCMRHCRREAKLYCFGGFIDSSKHLRDVLNKTAAGAINREEVAKIKGILETLESGRRAFWVDDGTYFKEDPVPYMGDLGSYDLQIPDSWTTGRLNSGFSFFAPTQHVISLFRKLLTISILPREQERHTWASTNLLLDPTGQQRDSKHVPPAHRPALDENLFDDEPESLAGAYGQAEFESPWGGGIDVRVLDARRFKTSEGRLGRRQFGTDDAREGQALYWHCVCCGDSLTNDYIAGALGFHQPWITHSLPSPSSLPSLPLILRTPELRGTAAEIQFAISLLLQIAHDSGRVLVPPLAGFVREWIDGAERETERYVWRLFPAPLWAHLPRGGAAHGVAEEAKGGARRIKRPPAGIDVREPGFVRHAIEYLREAHADHGDARRLLKELEEPLVLDMRELGTLGALIHGLTRPFWSTERVVAIEGLERYMGKEGWELRAEFQGLSMCRLGVERFESGSCAQLCPL